MKKYKILMALMGLEIGGAETHVVELSQSTIEANARFFESADEVPRQAFTKRSWQRQGFAITMCR